MMLIIISGPTASGKSAIAVDIACEMNGEIIGADSVQIYRNLVIGSAAPRGFEKRGVKHHLIATLSLEEEIDAGSWSRQAAELVCDIQKRGKMPIIVGGTNFYIHSFIHGLSPIPRISDTERRRIHAEYRDRPVSELYDYLRSIDSDWAEKISSPNDRQRILRGIEVYRYTGKTVTEWHEEPRIGGYLDPFLMFAPDWPRPILHERIAHRSRMMLENGMIDEVRGIMEWGYTPENTSVLGSVGYEQVFRFLRGEIESREELRELIARDTRRLARRQITWLRREKNVCTIPHEHLNEAVSIVRNNLRDSRCGHN